MFCRHTSLKMCSLSIQPQNILSINKYSVNEKFCQVQNVVPGECSLTEMVTTLFSYVLTAFKWNNDIQVNY